MSIEELRKLPSVGNWNQPYAESTYLKMPKSEIIQHLAVAFSNWRITELALQRSSAFAKGEIPFDD